MTEYTQYSFFVSGGQISPWPWPEVVGIEASLGRYQWILTAAVWLIQAASYLLTGISLYRIAKNRGFAKCWLAWVPYLSSFYLLGKIADDIAYRNGQKKSYRKILLPTGVILAVLMVVNLLLPATPGDMFPHGTGEQMQAAALFIFPLVVICAVGMIAFSILGLVFQLICLNRIYKDYGLRQNILFVVFGIFVGLIRPISLVVLCGRQSQSITNPPGHWEAGAYYQNYASPYQQTVGFDPYSMGTPYQPPYTGAAYQNPNRPPFSGNPSAGQAPAGGGFQAAQPRQQTPPAGNQPQPPMNNTNPFYQASQPGPQTPAPEPEAHPDSSQQSEQQETDR